MLDRTWMQAQTRHNAMPSSFCQPLVGFWQAHQCLKAGRQWSLVNGYPLWRSAQSYISAGEASHSIVINNGGLFTTHHQFITITTTPHTLPALFFMINQHINHVR
jgi:hypothetical protein